jgi:hypothetical protein
MKYVLSHIINYQHAAIVFAIIITIIIIIIIIIIVRVALQEYLYNLAVYCFLHTIV